MEQAIGLYHLEKDWSFASDAPNAEGTGVWHAWLDQ